MLRRLFVAALVSGSLMAASGPTTAQATVSVDVNLHFGSGHSFWFEHQPRFVAVPHSVVYYSAGPECDVYRYGSWYYVNNGYEWYRSASYGGPFVRIAYIALPRPIVVISPKYRHYSGHVVTRDPWANRWRDSRDSNVRWRDDGRHGRNDRDDRSDDRWAQKHHGKNRSHGKPGRDVSRHS